MVASSSRTAAQAGTEILQAGGNAVDAAVATGFALAVVYPEAGNLGGGGYTVIRMADGRTATLDYRETAPAASFRDMYVDSARKLTNFSINGRSASAIPAAVAGLIATHARFGSLPLVKVMAPAIRLAKEGFIVDSALARSVSGKKEVLAQYAGAEVFLPGGVPVAVGSRLVQADLAQTLETIAREGANGFYRGRIAQLIVDEMQRGCDPSISAKARASHGCGLITAKDLAGYKPIWRKPVTTAFRGYTLLTMPPSSSGGITLGETLNILSGFSSLPRYGTTAYIHLLTSAFQRAFIDRNSLLGDPAFVKIPMERLSSQKYAARLGESIDPAKRTPTLSVVMPFR